MQITFFWLAATLYSAATILFFVWLAFKKEGAAGWGRILAALGLLPHGISLIQRWIEVGHGPYSSRYEVLSSNAFVLTAAYLLAVLWAKELKGLGFIVMPAAFLLMGWASGYFEVKSEVPVIFKSYWLYLHITFAKAFAACIIIAAAGAIAYLIKIKKPEALARFPSLEKLDLYAYQFLLISFLFLGVMIAAGSLWAHQSWGRYWAWDPIETSSLVTWIVFGIILHFRALHRWSGQRMAYLTLVALAFAVTTVFVVAIAVPTIHNSYMVGK